MSTQKTAPVYRGVGNVDDVYREILNLPEQDDSVTCAIADLHKALQNGLIKQTRNSECLALICSYLNISFRQTGRLFSVSDKGSVGIDYFIDDTTRNTIADLANLP